MAGWLACNLFYMCVFRHFSPANQTMFVVGKRTRTKKIKFMNSNESSKILYPSDKHFIFRLENGKIFFLSFTVSFHIFSFPCPFFFLTLIYDHHWNTQFLNFSHLKFQFFFIWNKQKRFTQTHMSILFIFPYKTDTNK